MIHVIATVELQPNSREAFLKEYAKLVPLVKAEQGCIEYGAAVDVQSSSPAQVPMRDNVVTVVEKWESLEALAAHAAAPHMQKYRGRVKDYVIRVSLQVLQPVT